LDEINRLRQQGLALPENLQEFSEKRKEELRTKAHKQAEYRKGKRLAVHGPAEVRSVNFQVHLQ
jgi:uncharacterized coiled-coil DUF342 family protein